MTDCESIICKLPTIQKPSPYPRQKEKRNAKRKEISDQKSGIQPNKTQKAYEVEKCKYDLDQNFSESTSAMMINAMNFRGVSQDTSLICCTFVYKIPYFNWGEDKNTLTNFNTYKLIILLRLHSSIIEKEIRF